MEQKTTYIFFVLLVLSLPIRSQKINDNRKKTAITKTERPPKIDGNIEDYAWKNATILSDFFIFKPDNGKPAPDSHKTHVKMVYDNEAIYISAEMFAPTPSSIPTEFTNRDNTGNTDFFLVTLNPNDDGQNPFLFIVTSSGVQSDAKVSNGNEDFNWSAVWDSDIRFTDHSWIVEMKIPYRALRFANQPVQSWGVNFHRRVQNLNAQFTWNKIDNEKGIWTQYDGVLKDLKNITPPTRLILYPYASNTITNSSNETTNDWSVGMDIKYGITENFTLDATLIPDFGQTAFDNVELNLGPFEQQFSEQRQFFTEGTELFSKGNLFYSRRVGGKPIDQFDVKSQVEDHEELIKNPDKSDMLNAVKISGRTGKGLGIGVFNAITSKTEATILNKKTNTSRKFTTNPFANYNILVFDKQFNQNSSVTLINTNVTRKGDFRDANVTGLLWRVENKKSTYNVNGSIRMSAISDDDKYPNNGYSFDTSIGKHAGSWRGEIGYQFDNKDFNPNDLGILFRNNQQRIYGFLGYRLLKPKGIFNEYGINFYYNFNFLHNPNIFTGNNAGISFWSQTKKRFGFGGNIHYNSVGKNFFEPREGTESGIFFKTPRRININHWGSSDYRKKLAIDYRWFYTFFSNDPRERYGFSFGPRYRFNNRFSLIHSFAYTKINDQQGFVRKINDDFITDNPHYDFLLGEIIFGQRDRTTYNNSLTGKYSFSVNSSLSLAFRHNWSVVPYENQFYHLNKNDGTLLPNTYQEDHDQNFNSWNLDLNYIWQFAPGSQLIAFYRNSINPDKDFAPATLSFTENIQRLFQENIKHTFSLRLIYFLDYNRMKNIF